MSATSKRPFPLLLPTSTSSPESIRDNDWSSFRELGSLHDHWTLKQWAPGRSGYYWYLTFNDPDLIGLVTQCQESLGTSNLDLVPTDGLHLTMLGIGTTDQVADDALQDITEHARKRLASVKAFDLRVGPLAGSRSAIRFSVAPWDPLLELHQVLRECTAAVRPSSRLTKTSEFRPHLGIAYINKQQPANDLVDTVAELRRLPPATARVTKVDLVELQRVGRRYVWRDRAVLPLDD